MNNLQKIFVMVGVSSFAILLITIFALDFGLQRSIDSSFVDNSISRWQDETGYKLIEPPSTKYDTSINNKDIYLRWKKRINRTEGIERFSFDLSLFFESGLKTNWLGIISIFNIIVCLIGFFLFKDK